MTLPRSRSKQVTALGLNSTLLTGKQHCPRGEGRGPGLGGAEGVRSFWATGQPPSLVAEWAEVLKALASMLKAVSNNPFYFLKSFLTFKFLDSGPLPRPRVTCLDNKNCHPGSCLCEIAAAAQPHVLRGRRSRELGVGTVVFITWYPKTADVSFDMMTPSPIWRLNWHFPLFRTSSGRHDATTSKDTGPDKHFNASSHWILTTSHICWGENKSSETLSNLLKATQPPSGRVGMCTWLQMFNHPVRWRTRTTTTAQPRETGTSLSVFIPRQATSTLAWGLFTPASQQKPNLHCLLATVRQEWGGGCRHQQQPERLVGGSQMWEWGRLGFPSSLSANSKHLSSQQQVEKFD